MKVSSLSEGVKVWCDVRMVRVKTVKWRGKCGIVWRNWSRWDLWNASGSCA